MKLVKDIQLFFSVIGLIVAMIIIIIIGNGDQSVVIAAVPGSITTMNPRTGKVETDRNWWNNDIKANDIINPLQIVIGHDNSMPLLNLEINEDSMIAKTTKPQG